MNDIPGAPKDSKGRDGRADIMLRTVGAEGNPVVYIWEIKAAGRVDEAQTQLKGYVDHVPGGGGRAGWWLEPGIIPDGKGGIIKVKTSSKVNAPTNKTVGTGVRLYEDNEESDDGTIQPPGPSDWLWGLLGLGLSGAAGAGVSTGGSSRPGGVDQPGPPVPQPQPVDLSPVGFQMPFA